MQHVGGSTAPAPVADVQGVRAQVLKGAAPLDVFADAIGKSARMVRNYIRDGMPCVYIGRDVYPLVEEGAEWLRTRRQSDPEPRPDPEPRGVGRPRKAA